MSVNANLVWALEFINSLNSREFNAFDLFLVLIVTIRQGNHPVVKDAEPPPWWCGAWSQRMDSLHP